MLDFSVTTYTQVRARVSIQCDPFDPIVPDIPGDISESILSEEVTVPQVYAAARSDEDYSATSVRGWWGSYGRAKF